MNDDKTLLELAAKAAGIKGAWQDGPFEGLVGVAINEVDIPWNPLRNDGQALRLAVKLGLGISIPLANKRTDVVTFSGPIISAIEAHGDPYAATRRAIVRAAAEIGKTL